jgi:hypothetical protein
MNKYVSKMKSKTLLLLFFVGVMFSFIPPKYSLIGKWTICNPDGTPSGEYIDFYKDGTYDINLPDGQIGERGFYNLKDSVFSIKNAKDACGKNYWGSYGLAFHGSDSVHFSIIKDTCSKRRMDIVGFNPGLKRYKTK